MSKRVRVLSCACALSFLHTVSAVNSTWTATAGIWNQPSNWSSTPTFPNNGVDHYDVAITNPAAIVSLNGGNFSIDTLTLVDGLVTGAGTLTLEQGGAWSGGSLASVGTLNNNGVLLFDTTSHYLSRITIHNRPGATIQWTAGYMVGLTPQEGGRILNDGLFEDYTDDPWTWSNAAIPVFDNNGTYRTLGSSLLTKSIQAQFNNAGTLKVEGQNLKLLGGGTHVGTFTVSAGRTLGFSDFNEFYSAAGSGTTEFSATSRIVSSGTVAFASFLGSAHTRFDGSLDTRYLRFDSGGSGSVLFSSGAKVLQAGAADIEHYSGITSFNTGQVGGVVFNNAILSGGIIAGTDNLYFLGNVTAEENYFRGSGSNVAVVYGNLEYTGIRAKTYEKIAFYTGTGKTAAVNGTGPIFLDSADFINSAGATFNVNVTATVQDRQGTFPSRFFNDGSLTHNAVGTSMFMTEFNNGTLGNVKVASGALALLSGGTHSGSMTIQPSALLEFGGHHTIASTATITGAAGSVLRLGTGTTQSSGTISVDSLLVDRNELTVNNAVLSVTTTSLAPGNFATGAITMHSGTFNNSGNVQVGTNGTGTLFLDSGAKMTSASADIAAIHFLSTGRARVSGAGTRWTISNDIHVGVAGNATLEAVDGGEISNQNAIIGETTDAFGWASIDGAGSKWLNSGTMAIGVSGKGTLTISNGAQVQSTSASIAQLAGSRGFAQIDGAASSWIISGSLAIGGDSSNSGGLGQFSQLNGTVKCPGGTRIWPQAGYRFASGTFSTGTLTLTGGGTMSLDGGANKTLQVTALNIDPSSHLDLTDNRAIVDYTGSSPIATIRDYLRSGFANGAWNGKGIHSTSAAGDPSERTAIAYGENSALLRTTFGDINVDATSVLLATTYTGDANMNGTVDSTDFGNFLSGYGTSNNVWMNGDFDYDGKVNTQDFNYLAYNFGLTFAPAPGPLGALVPEPSLGLIALATMAFCARRRHRLE